MCTDVVGVVRVRLLVVIAGACQNDTVMATGMNSFLHTLLSKQATWLFSLRDESLHCWWLRGVEWCVPRATLVSGSWDYLTEQCEKFCKNDTKLEYSVSHNFLIHDFLKQFLVYMVKMTYSVLNTIINSKFVHLLAGMSSWGGVFTSFSLVLL